MGLDLWFREDVARILASVGETVAASVEGTGVGGEEVVEGRQAQVVAAYQRGFADALRVVGIAFGVGMGEGREASWMGETLRLLGGEVRSGYRGRNGGRW